MPQPIEFYFDFVSPYGYLAATKIDALADRYGRTVEWRPFLLGVTVMKVMGLKPIMETPLKSDYAALDLPRMARLLGAPLAAPDMKNVNSLAASRAYLWTREREPELAKRLADRLLRRLWAEGRDITHPDAVVHEAAALGLDGAAVRAALRDDRVKGLLRAAVDRAVERRVFGSPYFIVDGEPIWGVDRLWMVEHWRAHGSWELPTT